MQLPNAALWSLLLAGAEAELRFVRRETNLCSKEIVETIVKTLTITATEEVVLPCQTAGHGSGPAPGRPGPPGPPGPPPADGRSASITTTASYGSPSSQPGKGNGGKKENLDSNLPFDSLIPSDYFPEITLALPTMTLSAPSSPDTTPFEPGSPDDEGPTSLPTSVASSAKPIQSSDSEKPGYSNPGDDKQPSGPSTPVGRETTTSSKHEASSHVSSSFSSVETGMPVSSVSSSPESSETGSYGAPPDEETPEPSQPAETTTSSDGLTSASTGGASVSSQSASGTPGLSATTGSSASTGSSATAGSSSSSGSVGQATTTTTTTPAAQTTTTRASTTTSAAHSTTSAAQTTSTLSTTTSAAQSTTSAAQTTTTRASTTTSAAQSTTSTSSSSSSTRSSSTPAPAPTYVRRYAADMVDKLQDASMNKLKEYLKSQGGSGCTIENAAVRREWGDLSLAERKEYTTAVQCLKERPPRTPSSVARGAKSRYDDFIVTHIQQTNLIHNTASFLSWHRYFTWAYEKALRDECGYTGYQPYWNWARYASDPANSPIFDGSEGSLGGSSQGSDGCAPPGPFKELTVSMGPGNILDYNPRCIKRDASQYWAQQCTADKTMIVLNEPDIGTFQDRMQYGNSIHAGGHFTIGGDPGGDVYASPGDPIFYLHHAMVDRVWWIWQLQDLDTRLSAVDGRVGGGSNRRGTLQDSISLGYADEGAVLGELLNTTGGKGGAFCYIYY